MAEQIKAFVGIVLGGLCIALGFMFFGWWILLPMALGVSWQLAGQISASKVKPAQQPRHPNAIASTPSKPASTVTWQQTVEAIERSRSGAADAIVKSNH